MNTDSTNISHPDQAVPLVSVVITAFNRPDYLRNAVTSVLAQTFTDIEIIVVDDCSPTDPSAVLREFDAPIHFVRMPTNGGANRARNEGVRRARGHYVAFLDDDDIWLPTKLELQLPKLAHVTACLCGYEYLDSGKVFVRPVQQITASMLKQGNFYCGMSGLICEQRWLLENPFDETLANGQDWDVYVRLAQDKPIAYVGRPLLRYRRGSHDSITTRVKTMGTSDMERRLTVAYKHRQWMGERDFRLRVARTILGYIGHRPEPWKLVLLALRKSGWRATTSVLAEKFSNFMRRGGRVTSH
jgi:GalNAc5-diNAcBac-PP-undecaprenol beta-1,3-glucosyltransferase